MRSLYLVVISAAMVLVNTIYSINSFLSPYIPHHVLAEIQLTNTLPRSIPSWLKHRKTRELELKRTEGETPDSVAAAT
jgi:hypothetical protein